MNPNQIFQTIQKASELFAEACRLNNLALSAILEIASNAHSKSDNIIETLVSPEKGDIYDIDELAKVLKLSKASIYRLCNTGKLPFHKPGAGKLIFYRHEISLFLKKTKKFSNPKTKSL